MIDDGQMNSSSSIDDDESEQSVKTKIIKCKTNNQPIQMPSYNILTSNGPTISSSSNSISTLTNFPSTTTSTSNVHHSLEIPSEHTSIKLHIRRVCSPSSSNDTLAIHPTSNLLCQTSSSSSLVMNDLPSQQQQQILTTKIIPRQFFNSTDFTSQTRRFVSTRRTSLVDNDGTATFTLTKTTNISDENILKKPAGRSLSQKRKTIVDSQEKKRTKLTSRTSTTPVQTRSSSRLKQKSTPQVVLPTSKSSAATRTKRHLSTEFTTPTTSENGTNTTDELVRGEFRSRSTNEMKSFSTHECQTSDDLIEIVHQASQTNVCLRTDKSTYTDLIDAPLCENSTQTILKDEQETQTTDLNYPNDSHVYLFDYKENQTQSDEILENNSTVSSPRRPSSPSTSFLPSTMQQVQQRLSSPYIDFSLTNSNHDRLQLFQSLIHTEEHPNGGASLIRTYYNEFLRLSHENAHFFVNYFFNLVYGEMNQRARYSIGVLHDGARYLPDLVEYFSLTYPKMIVKTSNIINSKEVLTTTMGEYRNRLVQTYSNGTFRSGPLLSISLVGKVTGKEECGTTNY